MYETQLDRRPSMSYGKCKRGLNWEDYEDEMNEKIKRLKLCSSSDCTIEEIVSKFAEVQVEEDCPKNPKRILDCLNSTLEKHKRARLGLVEEEDRLSSLPDCILEEILSRLQIDVVVRTAVLSHRWCHLWTQVPRVQLDLGSWESFDSISHLFDTLDHIRNQLRWQKICSFHINVPDILSEESIALLECWLSRVSKSSSEEMYVTRKGEPSSTLLYQIEFSNCPKSVTMYPDKSYEGMLPTRQQIDDMIG